MSILTDCIARFFFSLVLQFFQHCTQCHCNWIYPSCYSYPFSKILEFSVEWGLHIVCSKYDNFQPSHVKIHFMIYCLFHYLLWYPQESSPTSKFKSINIVSILFLQSQVFFFYKASEKTFIEQFLSLQTWPDPRIYLFQAFITILPNATLWSCFGVDSWSYSKGCLVFQLYSMSIKSGYVPVAISLVSFWFNLRSIFLHCSAWLSLLGL